MADMIDLTNLEQLAKAATPEWEAYAKFCPDRNGPDCFVASVGPEEQSIRKAENKGFFPDEPEIVAHRVAYLNAASPDTILKLLEYVKELEGACEFYAENFTWSRVGADARHMGATGDFKFGNMYAPKARAALESKKRILG